MASQQYCWCMWICVYLVMYVWSMCVCVWFICIVWRGGGMYNVCYRCWNGDFPYKVTKLQYGNLRTYLLWLATSPLPPFSQSVVCLWSNYTHTEIPPQLFQILITDVFDFSSLLSCRRKESNSASGCDKEIYYWNWNNKISFMNIYKVYHITIVNAMKN